MSSRSRAPSRRPGPTRSPPSTPCSGCGSTCRSGGPSSARVAVASPGPPSVPSRSTSPIRSRRRSRSRSSAPAGSRMRATRSSSSWPGLRRCRSARPRSPIRPRRSASSKDWRGTFARTVSARSATSSERRRPVPEDLRFGPFLLLEPSVRAELRARARDRRLREGDFLIEEHDADDDAYLLLEGSLRVVTEGRVLAIVGAPALVGEVAVVTATDRHATVVADTPGRVLQIPGVELRRLMMGQPLFANAMRERTDLLLADAFLKRDSPFRDLPAEIVATLVRRLRPREFAPDQLIPGEPDDLYLVRRGAVERMGAGQQTRAGQFVQRQRDERYAAVGETWIYELRMSDVAMEIIRHQEQVRGIAVRLGDHARVRAKQGVTAMRATDLGGALVRDATR